MKSRIPEAQKVKRYRIGVTGTVQGVGFRPFVYQLAGQFGLSGFVRNTPEGVEIEVEGSRSDLDSFLAGLTRERPPASRITGLTSSEMAPHGQEGFSIENSRRRGDREVVIPPDIATCEECARELFDPLDRRYGYPFTNCTHCGPRYTIVQEIPYDRERTTMRLFTMCAECKREYRDPSRRRFHAQPNACGKCGPALSLLDGRGKRMKTDDPLSDTVGLLLGGSIVAVKGLGGFHLACLATASDPVRRLRERKRREEKPFAIMSADTASVATFAHVNAEERRLLEDPSRPILLLKKRDPCPIAPEVAPALDELGVMLPYTPLHHLLMRSGREKSPLALIMTSANLGEEPIVKDNREAVERLGRIADYFLIHNRDIHQRADDSVTRVIRGKPVVLRRSRGYVPSPIILPREVKEVLGCGAHLKNTVCLTKGRNAYLSQHIGDLENDLSYGFYIETIAHLERILGLTPRIIAHDLHPDYLSTLFAKERPGSTTVAVQHHHAHIASCLAENAESGAVIGICCDGTGLGDDGTIWGGEILLADFSRYERIGCFEQFALPGGEKAIEEPWRSAYSLIKNSQSGGHREAFSGLFPEVPKETLALVERMIDCGINSPLTSSLGRLFDAVASMTGLSRHPTYEGQAAISLEKAIRRRGEESYDTDVLEGEMLVIRTGELIRSIVEDISSGMPGGEVSLRFHNFLANSLHQAAILAHERTGVKTAAISGGCFQNVYLLEELSGKLERSGFRVLTHSEVPTNDGGISLGQTIVADAVSREQRTL
jgi:hydrogenase maturation protein HypF